MGLSDAKIEGVWVWVDNNEVANYTGWYPGEPNSFNGQNEDCASFSYLTQFSWADFYCLTKEGFICEQS